MFFSIIFDSVKSNFVIAFISFMLVFSIVAPSVLTLIEMEAQTAVIEKGESEEQKEAKEKEIKEKKLISENVPSSLFASTYPGPQSSAELESNHITWLLEVPIPPPEALF